MNIMIALSFMLFMFLQCKIGILESSWSISFFECHSSEILHACTTYHPWYYRIDLYLVLMQMSYACQHSQSLWTLPVVNWHHRHCYQWYGFLTCASATRTPHALAVLREKRQQQAYPRNWELSHQSWSRAWTCDKASKKVMNWSKWLIPLTTDMLI